MLGGHHIYFHSPCFDGIASAVLVWDFFATRHNLRTPVLCPVNYDLRDTWVNCRLEATSLVVDFLYHPQADFWADHHLTSFMNPEVREGFQKRAGPVRIYDAKASSCAVLLWKSLSQNFGYYNQKFQDLVDWADKIDSASYRSVEQVIECKEAALKLNLCLALEDAKPYSVSLVSFLHEHSLEEVARLPVNHKRFCRARSLMQVGLERFQRAVKFDPDGFALFDVDGSQAIISRYAPFYFLPNKQVRYSLGVVRSKDEAKITAMRNPWNNFKGVALGPIFQEFGGGGHERVAAVVLRGPRAAEATRVVDKILARIKEAETGHFSLTL